MKWLIDAQLPRKLTALLIHRGEDAVHTLDLPMRNATSDLAITEIADRESWMVVTKDQDFVNSYLLRRETEATASDFHRKYQQQRSGVASRGKSAGDQGDVHIRDLC